MPFSSHQQTSPGLWLAEETQSQCNKCGLIWGLFVCMLLIYEVHKRQRASSVQLFALEATCGGCFVTCGMKGPSHLPNSTRGPSSPRDRPQLAIWDVGNGFGGSHPHEGCFICPVLMRRAALLFHGTPRQRDVCSCLGLLGGSVCPQMAKSTLHGHY